MAPRSTSSTLVAAIRTHSDALIDLVDGADLDGAGLGGARLSTVDTVSVGLTGAVAGGTAGGTDPARTPAVAAGRSLVDLIGHLVAVVVRHTPEGSGPDRDPPSRWPLPAVGAGAPTGPGSRQGVTSPVTDLSTVLAALRSAVAGLPAGPGLDSAGPVPYTDRVEVVPADLYGVILGEFLVHGHDLAAARHRRWRIAPEDAVEALRAMATVLPARLDPARAHDLRGVIELQVRGDRRYLCRFTDGALVVDPAARPARVDVRISGRPAAMLMMLRGRLPLWRGLATGKLLVWGRRPGLASSACGLFLEP